MDLLLKDKVAIVTGSSHGIGRAAALEFGRAGACVTVVGKVAVRDAEEVAKQIREFGSQAIVAMTDVTDRSQVDNLVNVTLKQFGKIDILVNNAGFLEVMRFREMTDELWRRTIEVHLQGTFNCTKAVLEHMIERKSGKIINVTSPGAIIGGYAMSAYSAAKGGIISLTMALARELARYKINVNGISPAAETRMSDEFKKIPGFWERLNSDHPLGIPKPEDIAHVFVFLASDWANYITGQIIRADGGYVIGQ